MRTTLLIFLALSVLGISSQASERPNRLTLVSLPDDHVAKLELVNEWLTKNIDDGECPERDFFGLLRKGQKPTIVGYQVLVDCPDAPTPRMAIYFDHEQRYVDPEDTVTWLSLGNR